MTRTKNENIQDDNRKIEIENYTVQSFNNTAYCAALRTTIAQL